MVSATMNSVDFRSVYDPASSTQEAVQITGTPFSFPCANNGTSPLIVPTLSYSQVIDTSNLNFSLPPNNIPVYSMNFSMGFADPDAAQHKSLTSSNDLWGCATVSMYYYYDDSVSASPTHNSIVLVRGYNLCKYNNGNPIGTLYTPDITSSRTVERALQWVSSIPGI